MTFLSFSLYALVTVLDPYEGLNYDEPNAYTFETTHDDCYCPEYYEWR